MARPEQIDRGVPRHADDWVRDLDEAQVARYAVLFDAMVAAARAHGRGVADLVCEVLSTQPYPLARVMVRHGLGRFRVTQKARLDDPDDVYRSENTEARGLDHGGQPRHPPLWRLADGWPGTDAGRVQAEYLARRLVPDGDAGPLARALAADSRRLVHAKAADLFASRSRQS